MSEDLKKFGLVDVGDATFCVLNFGEGAWKCCWVWVVVVIIIIGLRTV